MITQLFPFRPVRQFHKWIDERTLQLEFTPEHKRGLAIVSALFLAVGVLYLVLAQGSSQASPNISPISLPSKAAALAIPTFFVVDVAGKVKEPGVYSLPKGARAIDAIKAAGNALPGVSLSDINLASLIFDGEQITVGAPAPQTSARKVGKSKAGTVASGIIGINSATQVQLESLPGIGPVMAARIIAYRTKSGPFTTLDDLKKVSGMGKSKFAQVLPHIRL
jgi:competence protein ComEA